MPQPKKRHTTSRQGKRRGANWKLKLKSLSKCPACGAPTLPHQACSSCGMYKGRQVIALKKEKKTKKKES